MQYTASVVPTQWKVDPSTGHSTSLIDCPSHNSQTNSRYGEVDYIYGKKAYENHNGFTNAQSALNVIELLMQVWFLRLRTKPGKENKALMVGYTVSVMTLSKTILYWLQEYYSGYGLYGGVLTIGMRRLDIIVLSG
jgi:hypothetical protein